MGVLRFMPAYAEKGGAGIRALPVVWVAPNAETQVVNSVPGTGTAKHRIRRQIKEPAPILHFTA
jgi:hypothetical protein